MRLVFGQRMENFGYFSFQHLVTLDLHPTHTFGQLFYHNYVPFVYILYMG